MKRVIISLKHCWLGIENLKKLILIAISSKWKANFCFSLWIELHCPWDVTITHWAQGALSNLNQLSENIHTQNKKITWHHIEQFCFKALLTLNNKITWHQIEQFFSKHTHPKQHYMEPNWKNWLLSDWWAEIVTN
jgi:hypothetical protein